MTAAAMMEPADRDATSVWVVVISKPFQETRAKRELEHQGFEVYLPMRIAEGRKGDLVMAPLFPRYLFARVSLRLDHWKAIWSTLGVHGLLGTLDRPTGVADVLIERVRAQEDAGFIRIGLENQTPKLKRGQKVKTMDEFGFEGIFEERVDERRALILVSFLGRDSRFYVDVRKLRAAEDQ